VLPLIRLGNANHSAGHPRYLRRIGGSATQVGQLAVELRNGNPYVREAAAYALGLAGAESKRVVPALIPVIRDEYPNVQLAAIDALGSIGPVARPAVLALVQLPDEDSSVHSSVRAALNRIGGDPGLVPGLVALLDHPNDRVRESAAYMLGMIGPEARSAIVPLAEAARQGSDVTRGQAAMALRKILQ
jgi:HEAT repeat protein